MGRRLFAVVRSLIVAPLFVSLWMYFVPMWIVGPGGFDHPRPLGWIVVALGATIVLPCFWQFAWRGLGTPAPFDPPRRLVITGPYRFVRNPMYLGFGVVLIGEAIVYPNLTGVILTMTAILWAVVTLFVVGYEEPTLRRTFGSDYENYYRAVHRWLPRLRPYERRTQNAE